MRIKQIENKKPSNKVGLIIELQEKCSDKLLEVVEWIVWENIRIKDIAVYLERSYNFVRFIPGSGSQFQLLQMPA